MANHDVHRRTSSCNFAELQPSRLQGLVWEDFDNDGVKMGDSHPATAVQAESWQYFPDTFPIHELDSRSFAAGILVPAGAAEVPSDDDTVVDSWGRIKASLADSLARLKVLSE